MGIASANRAVRALDSLGPEGRQALIPLLDESDAGIRAFAARDLLKIEPERALAVSKAIAEGEAWFPQMAASDLVHRFNKKKADG